MPRMDEGRKRVIGVMAAIMASLHMRTADDLFGCPQGSPHTDKLIEASILSGLRESWRKLMSNYLEGDVQSTQWERKGHHRGVFDDYTVMGFKYENPSPEIGWHISAWETKFGLIHDHWVAGNDFYSVTIHSCYKGTPINLIGIYHPPITEHIDAAERKAVLKAIAEWGGNPSANPSNEH